MSHWYFFWRSQKKYDRLLRSLSPNRTGGAPPDPTRTGGAPPDPTRSADKKKPGRLATSGLTDRSAISR